MALLRSPKNVSPTIKFARWSFLIWGVIYGMNKRSVLEAIEKKESALRKQALERSQLCEKKASEKAYIDLLVTFGEKFGMEFPPDWKPPM